MTGPVDPGNVVNTRQEDLAESLRLLKEEFESMKRENEDQKKELKDLRENEGRGVARTATTTQVSVPKLRPGSTFKEFQRDVEIWKTTSLLPKDRLAATLINEMPDKDKFGGLKKYVIDHIGVENVNKEDALDKMMEKLKEFLEEQKFVRGVQWLGRLFSSKQREGRELESYFSSLDQLFNEAKDDYECDMPDFIKACVLVTHCTSISHEGLGHIMQNVDVDNIPAGKTLYDEIKSLMKRHRTAVNALKRPAGVLVQQLDMFGNPLNESGNLEVSDEDDNEVLFTGKKFKSNKRQNQVSFGAGSKSSPGQAAGAAGRVAQDGVCYSCNKPGHIARDCPERVERLKQLKRNTLAANRVWDNKDGTFLHPDGRTYSFASPVKIGYQSYVASTARHLRPANEGQKNEIEKRKLERQKAAEERKTIQKKKDLDDEWQASLTAAANALGGSEPDLYDGGLEDFDSYGSFMSGVMKVDNNLEINSVNISGSLPGHAIVDTGCQKTCASVSWVKEYIKNLPQKYKKLVKSRESGNKFRFGNPEVFPSQKYFLIPAKLGKSIKLLGVDVLENDIPLLISRETMKNLGFVLHYPKEDRENYLTLEGDRERKVTMVNASGHDWIDIMPSEGDEEMDQVVQGMRAHLPSSKFEAGTWRNIEKLSDLVEVEGTQVNQNVNQVQQQQQRQVGALEGLVKAEPVMAEVRNAQDQLDQAVRDKIPRGSAGF